MKPSLSHIFDITRLQTRSPPQIILPETVLLDMPAGSIKSGSNIDSLSLPKHSSTPELSPATDCLLLNIYHPTSELTFSSPLLARHRAYRSRKRLLVQSRAKNPRSRLVQQKAPLSITTDQGSLCKPRALASALSGTVVAGAATEKEWLDLHMYMGYVMVRRSYLRKHPSCRQ